MSNKIRQIESQDTKQRPYLFIFSVFAFTFHINENSKLVKTGFKEVVKLQNLSKRAIICNDDEMHRLKAKKKNSNKFFSGEVPKPKAEVKVFSKTEKLQNAISCLNYLKN